MQFIAPCLLTIRAGAGVATDEVEGLSVIVREGELALVEGKETDKSGE